MSKCTAPTNGHRTESARMNCPACRYRSRGYSFNSNYTNYFSPSHSSTSSYSNSISNKQGKVKAKWSTGNSTIVYTPLEIRTLTPLRENYVKRSSIPDLKDIFLCHAWDDRKGVAKELYDLLVSKNVKVWFSEKDVDLGSPLLREIDKGLANSRIGIVLVTPSFLNRIKGAGISEKELSALLSRDLLIPIVHDTTFEKLRDVSPLLGSRSGLDTLDDSLEIVADKLAELVTL